MFKKKLRCNFTGDFSQIMYALSCWQALLSIDHAANEVSEAAIISATTFFT